MVDYFSCAVLDQGTVDHFSCALLHKGTFADHGAGGSARDDDKVGMESGGRPQEFVPLATVRRCPTLLLQGMGRLQGWKHGWMDECG